MGNIWIREFTGGLDTRRMKETTAGGVLIKASNGHISRGGEFEKRAAFVPTYALPAGTVGMAEGADSIYVFGSGATPGGLPSGVKYQRLQHANGVTALSRILATDLYASKLYVVGEFADGSIFHFYDGVRITNWYDGRARASFQVTGGVEATAIAATGSFDITGGTSDPANTITGVLVAGVNLIAAPVQHTGDNATTAIAVAAAINGYTSVPDYTAISSGNRVIITATTTGPAANGRVIATTLTGDFSTGNVLNMAGGSTSETSVLADLQVNGVSVIGAPVLWDTSNEATAAAIASAINSHASAPEYSATSVGDKVNIVAAITGVAANGRAVSFSLEKGFSITPSSGIVMANGAVNPSGTYQPGSSVKTAGRKMYSTSGSVLHFSGVAEPTKWTTDNVGAGFIDMAAETSGAEQLQGIGVYQNNLAVFAERAIIIEYIDPDPALNRKVQTLNNTGTLAPRSITQFGDSDLFYLDASGLRSLRARDSSNAAATTDIGVPIDTLVIQQIEDLTISELQRVFGIIEPRDGRFWLVMKDVIFVFSFFNGAKVSAWSTYVPSTIVDGEEVPFVVEEVAVYRRRVYLRSGNTIYVYGGLSNVIQYDATAAEAWLPYLDANDPSRQKNFTGLDAALEGLWTVSVAFKPTDENTKDEVARYSETSFNENRTPGIGRSTHISLQFKSVGEGPAKLSSAVIHYEGDQIADK
jgi:hypothetical protein